MKEKEILKIDTQMDEFLCRNVCDVCYNNLSREKRETEWITYTKNGIPKSEKSERL